MKVLIVEDEDSIAEPLAEGLRREGFDVTRVATGEAALAAPEHDLVLLDLRLPDVDGLEVCRRLRGRSSVPIIVVTAKGEEVDRVVGLELGADDYIVKPFGFRELLARIRAVMRRARAESPERQALTAGASPGRRARARGIARGGAAAADGKEFELLSLLAEDPGAVVTRRHDPRASLEHLLVWRRQDDRRPRRLAAPEARRPRLDSDRPRRRLSPAAACMSRRLLVSYLTLTVAVLLALEVPLAFQFQRSERRSLTAKIERDAFAAGRWPRTRSRTG